MAVLMEAGLQILLFIIILLLMEELLQGPLEVGRFVGIHYMHVVNNIRPPFCQRSHIIRYYL